MKKIILASKSPRRKELLTLIGLEIEVDASETLETFREDLPINQAVELIAKEKAIEVASKHINDIIISADTVVILDQMILGKPKDKEDTIHMLGLLRGRIHQVLTSVCILADGKEELFSSITEVEMMDYSNAVIQAYVDTGEPLDKAGGYGIQGKGAILVKAIHGDYYTVMGLPLAEVFSRLEKYL